MEWGLIRHEANLPGAFDAFKRARNSIDKIPILLRPEREALVEPTQRKPLYHFMANRLISTMDSELQNTIQGNLIARSAAVGCALERYRLKHGAYPESLVSLIPEFIPEMPRDLIDGQPLRYRQTEDGLFKLWSIGEDDIDNGGRPRRPKGPQPAEPQGIDWVWPY